MMRGAYCRQLGARLGQRPRHLAEDVQPRLACACASASRRMSNVTPEILMSICRAVMPSAGAGDLEVHVAEVVLDAGDVGEHDVVVALLDEAHRDAGDRAP